MTTVIFYEKPGCINNTKQKQLLKASGCTVDERNLLTTAWTVETLSPFFAGMAVADWFNRTAPRVTGGEVDPDAMTAEEALAAMVADPLLIRRPLMQVGEARLVGFSPEAIAERFAVQVALEPQEDVESCPRTDPAHAGGCD